MGLFKRKKKKEIIGTGTDKTVNLNKEIDVFNYQPIPYAYTVEYADFLATAANEFRRIIKKASVDDLNENMLDSHIDSITDHMKTSALEQQDNHFNTVGHMLGKADGALVKAVKHRANLEKDRIYLEGEIRKYRKLKEDRNIH